MPKTTANTKSRHLQSSTPDPERTSGREYVQAVQRGFAVIKAFSAENPSLSMADVAQRTGLARAVARRYLFTLAELGCVMEREGRFTLTPKVLDLGFTYLSTMSVASIAQPLMEKAVAELHESCSLSVLDGREVVYVGRVPAKRIMSVNLVVGSRLPAHATSMGKVLLAYLPPEELDRFFDGHPLTKLSSRTVCDEGALRQVLAEVRQRGWALAEQESEDGIRSVAAPIWERGGKVAAAMNISAHASRVSRAEICRRHLPILLEATRVISIALGAAISDLTPPA